MHPTPSHVALQGPSAPGHSQLLSAKVYDCRGKEHVRVHSGKFTVAVDRFTLAFNRSTSVPLDLGRVGQEMSILVAIVLELKSPILSAMDVDVHHCLKYQNLLLGVISVLYSRIATTCTACMPRDAPVPRHCQAESNVRRRIDNCWVKGMLDVVPPQSSTNWGSGRVN